MKAIGEIKLKVVVLCDICGCSHNRIIRQSLYENTEQAINEAKVKLIDKAKKKYTCQVCKIITR